MPRHLHFLSWLVLIGTACCSAAAVVHLGADCAPLLGRESPLYEFGTYLGLSREESHNVNLGHYSLYNFLREMSYNLAKCAHCFVMISAVTGERSKTCLFLVSTEIMTFFWWSWYSEGKMDGLGWCTLGFWEWLTEIQATINTTTAADMKRFCLPREWGTLRPGSRSWTRLCVMDLCFAGCQRIANSFCIKGSSNWMLKVCLTVIFIESPWTYSHPEDGCPFSRLAVVTVSVMLMEILCMEPMGTVQERSAERIREKNFCLKWHSLDRSHQFNARS